MRNPFPDTDPEKVLEDVLTTLRAQVALGVLSFDAIVDRHIGDLVLDGLHRYVPDPTALPTDDPEEQRAWLIAVLDAEFAAALREQDEGEDLLDSERLTAAFRDLDANGILAREDYACCNTCAVSELAGEAGIEREARERDGRPPVRGYVFYHAQDAESLFPFLGFGSYVDRSPEGDTAVGEEVVEALRRHGLSPKWNGDPKRKIEGPSLRRRRTGHLARHPSAA